MTIDARRTAVAAITALAVWLGALAGLAATMAPASDYVAIGPRGALFQALEPSGARFLRETAGGLLIAGDGPATVRALYAHGAWLVLPAARGGCLQLGGRSQKRQTAQGRFQQLSTLRQPSGNHARL